ncbi:MAG: hypothetical protein M0042_09010 [Nitrospiraceae bacterium]|nr:hypothetical protein [Nitrospiraceae bacterium]
MKRLLVVILIFLTGASTAPAGAADRPPGKDHRQAPKAASTTGKQKVPKSASASPALLSPEDGAVVEPGGIAFSWIGTVEIPSYRIQVAGSAGFRKPLIEATTVAAAYYHERQLPPGSYRWRVKAILSGDRGGEWSVVRKLQIPVLPPRNTTAPSFINRGLLSTNTPTVSLALSAESFGGIDAYAVWEEPSPASGSASTWIPANGTKAFFSAVPFSVSPGDGQKRISVRFRDAAGAASAVVTGTVVLDTQPPTTTITSKPEESEDSTTARFSFAASEPVSEFQCSLDEGIFEKCTSPHTYTRIAPGPHTFAVKAIDVAGNVEPSPANASWTAHPPVKNMTPPHFINKGGTATDRRIVKLSLAALAQEKEGVSGYFVSENPMPPSAEDPGWTGVTPVKTFKRDVDFPMSEGAGKKMVYVWFRDEAGNLSDVQCGSIYRLEAKYFLWIFVLIQAVIVL